MLWTLCNLSSRFFNDIYLNQIYDILYVIDFVDWFVYLIFQPVYVLYLI